MKLLGLKQVRETYGFTMRELAEKLNVTANTINMWEKGNLEATDERVIELTNFFDIQTFLLLKSNHTSYEKMLIEVSRARYKIDEYKQSLDIDSPEINEELSGLSMDLWCEEDTTIDLLGTIRWVIDIYKNNNIDKYMEFDDVMVNIIELFKSDSKEDIEKFKLMVGAMRLYEDLEDWEDDYMLFCDTEQYIRKSIYDNIEKLYKIKMYKENKYKPYWMDEEE